MCGEFPECSLVVQALMERFYVFLGGSSVDDPTAHHVRRVPRMFLGGSSVDRTFLCVP